MGRCPPPPTQELHSVALGNTLWEKGNAPFLKRKIHHVRYNVFPVRKIAKHTKKYQWWTVRWQEMCSVHFSPLVPEQCSVTEVSGLSVCIPWRWAPESPPNRGTHVKRVSCTCVTVRSLFMLVMKDQHHPPLPPLLPPDRSPCSCGKRRAFSRWSLRSEHQPHWL